MTLPNFLVVGAPKAGTTSLYDYLRQHPEIFMPKIKALRYFIYRGQRDAFRYPAKTLEEYAAQFDDVTTEKAIGEATALYFEFEDAARRIKEVIPETKIIATLREPVQRAFSIYHMNLRSAGKNKGRTFLQALEDDESIRKLSLDGLKPFYDRFDRDKIKIVLLEDMERDTLGAVRSIFEFLGVAADFVPDLKVSNPGGVPKVKFMHDILVDPRVRMFSRQFLPESWVKTAKDIRGKNLRKHVMTEEEREKAYRYFEADIRATQDLIGMDLSHWLRPVKAKEFA